MTRYKKWIRLLLIGVFVAVGAPMAYRGAPIVRERESYRSFFPKEKFQERLKKPAAPWMEEQVAQDLAVFQKVSASSVEKTYSRMVEVLGPLEPIYHFRILGNKLYKYVPEGAPFSDTDTRTEKALKTLLLYAKVPDIDFVLCGLDGVPEHYFPSDFYLTGDPLTQAPVFAQAKRENIATQYIVLIPDQLCLSDLWFQGSQEELQSIPWDQKAAVAIWRGGLSDAGEPNAGQFIDSFAKTPRFALCKIGAEHPDVIDAGFAGLDCEEMEALMQKLGLGKPPLSKRAHLRGKYLPVLDGHMCTYPGYQWRLLSNSVCLKQESDQVQWFYKALKPYIHYIPVQNDMRDLVEKINWAKEHDEEAAQIAANAHAFASQNLLFEDVYFYLHFALCEYAKRQKMDFQALKQETRRDPHWKCIQYRKRLGLEKSVARLKHKIRNLL